MSAATAATVSEEEKEIRAAQYELTVRVMSPWHYAIGELREITEAMLRAAARVRAAPTPSPAPAGTRVTEGMVAQAKTGFEDHAQHLAHQDGLIEDELAYCLSGALVAALGTAATPGDEPVASEVVQLRRERDEARAYLKAFCFATLEPEEHNGGIDVHVANPSIRWVFNILDEQQNDDRYITGGQVLRAMQIVGFDRLKIEPPAPPPTAARQTTPAEDARRVALEEAVEVCRKLRHQDYSSESSDWIDGTSACIAAIRALAEVS